MQLTEQEIVRREKLVKLRALGIDPYPAALYPVNTMSTAIEKDYKEGKASDSFWQADAKKSTRQSIFCRNSRQ